MGKYRKYLMVFIVLMAVFFILEYKYHVTATIQSWGLPLAGHTVVLDPGHGGPDGGAVGEGLVEKDVTLAISLKVREYLSEQGVFVVMTRDTDTDLAAEDTKGLSRRKTEDLHKRLKILNESDADVFVSVHLNALLQSQYRGAQTFYNMQDQASEAFAKQMQESFKRNLGNTNRMAKPIQNIYLIKNADIPGALAEVGFLSNVSERELLKNSEYQDKVAFAIYEAIATFLQDKEENK